MRSLVEWGMLYSGSGFDVAVAFGAGDRLAFGGLRGMQNLVAHRTDDRDRIGSGGRLRRRFERRDDKDMFALRAFGFLAGVLPGDTKILAALVTMELDLIVHFGHDAVDTALGAPEGPAREMVRDTESFTT